VIFQIIILFFNIFLIPQFFLKHILYYFNFILLNINDLIANTFKFSPLYEKTLIKYDEYNLILGNIIKIFIVIFQIIILFFNIFLIPQFFLKHILYNLNLILFKIYDLLINIFKTNILYNKTLIEKIFVENTYNIIFANIFGIFVLIFQFIVIFYNSFLILETNLIRCLTLNFTIISNDISLDERIHNSSYFMFILQLLYGFIYLFINYTISILPSLYYILYDLDLKSKNTLFDAIKYLSNIIYNSKFFEFTQIFLGKYWLNIIFYYFCKLNNYHTIFYLSKTTDIIFVKILKTIYTEFYKRPFISAYFPLKYLLMYIGKAFQCISIKIKKRVSKLLDIIINIIALIITFIPFYSIYACYENDSKRIIFIEIPLFIYIIFNIWISGKALNDIIDSFN